MVQVDTEFHLYELGSISAAFYDLQTACLAPQCDGDLQFYLNHAAPGCHVLELGVGTGRIAWPLANFGFEVTGIDISEGMLALAREKAADYPDETARRLKLCAGNMVDFNFEDRFDLIIAPFRSFNQLTAPGQARACLEQIQKHLLPAGVAILHLMALPVEVLRHEAASENKVHSFDFPNGAKLSAAFRKRTLDLVRQILSLEIEYTYRESITVLRQSVEHWEMAWFGWQEFTSLAESAGLAVTAAYSDFHGRPPAADGDQVWILSNTRG